MSENNESAVDPGKGSDITLIDLAATLMRHWKFIVAVTAGTGFVAVVLAGISLLLPPEKSYLPNLYKPTAVMLVNSPDSSGGLSSLISSSGMTNLAGLTGISTGGKNYGQLAVAIGKSNPILDVLVDEFDLVERYKIKKNPRMASRKALLSHYSVNYAEKTGILTISFTDRDPELAKAIVNMAVDLLDRRFTTIGGNRNITKKDQLEVKLADVQVEMTRLESEIQAFQQKYGVITIDSIAKEQIATVAQVRSEVIMKEMEIKTYGDLSKVQDPALMRLKAERENLAKLLEELEKGFSSYEKILPTQQELPRLAIEFSHLQRDILIQQKIFELLTQQYELTKLQISGADPIIQILEPAEAPDMKSEPGRTMLVFVWTMGAFFASILGVFLFTAVRNIKADPVAMAKLRGGSR